MFTKTRLNHFEGFSSNSCGLINLIRNKNLIIIPSFTLLNTAVSTFVIKYILKVPVSISKLRLKVIYPQGTKEGNAQSKYSTGRAKQKEASREGESRRGGVQDRVPLRNNCVATSRLTINSTNSFFHIIIVHSINIPSRLKETKSSK